jgi:basic amino acid/polyamine antiporter, APA family
MEMGSPLEQRTSAGDNLLNLEPSAGKQLSTAQRLSRRKSIATIQEEAARPGLKRSLGPLHLTMIGIGSIIGAGIYVMTGTAAAHFAGPAILLSFVVAGFACTFAALCYAELASTIPVCGSAYTYAYVALGELAAWIMGWLLVLEYGVAAATVASGFSGYATNLLATFGAHIPSWLTTSTVESAPTAHGLIFIVGPHVNAVAAMAAFLATALLVAGVSESATVNAVIVVIKVAVLLTFVGFGISSVEPHHWVPFIPPSEGPFTYGWPGIFRAASVIFFAYLGFETVSTAAGEARNPQRDLPIGILSSLVACTLLYIAVAAVMTGVVPFRTLAVADPLAIAVEAMGKSWLTLFLKTGAVVGLFSVLLVVTYGQTRVFFAMSRDGLLPAIFHRLHPRLRTPWLGTIVLGTSIALIAGVLPITLLGDLVSLGTAISFCIVCGTVMWLRAAAPDLHRPFRVPLGGVRLGRIWIGPVPVMGVLMCLLMALPLLIDIVLKARMGNPIPAVLLASYCALGVLLYIAYGFKHSHLNPAAAR